MKNGQLLTITSLLISAPAIAQNQNTQLRRTIANLEQMDADKDGTVTRAELNAGRLGTFTRFDRNKDNQITPDDIPATMALIGGNDMFAQMKTTFDTNKDGNVSRDEFMNGPTTGFDMLDANKDNQVTKAERDAALAKAI